MILALIAALLLGVLSGTITGLTPGIHINLVSVILLSFSAALLNIISSLNLAIFIVSMAITHTFVDFIPSIFLGAPDEDSFLSVLPGHQFLLKGIAHEAVVYTLYGGLSALLIIIMFTPIFIYILPIIYPYMQKIMGFLLIILSIFLIGVETNKKRTLIIFLLAGFLGIASLNLNIKEPLLPLLSGLFGASNLLMSIKQNPKLPSQKISNLRSIKLTKISIIRSFLASMFSAPFTAFLPGLGAAQASLIGKQFLNIKDNKEFLFLLGAINTIVMGLSFIALYSIQKTRTGASVAVSRLIPELTKTDLFFIILTIVISGILAFFLSICISKIISKYINKIKYSKLSLIILIVLTLIIIIFSDFSIQGKIISLLIFITSTFLGILTILFGVSRMHLMGCLLVPTILFYLL